MIDGVVIVDKPAGMTSHDVVTRCRKVFEQRKVGHAGTLDPDATGVLVLGLGRATRLLRYMSGLGKSYRTEIVLGVSTATLDDSGEVTGRWDQSGVTLPEARAAAARLTGEISQVPPMVSAVKVGGRRLHQLARQGIEVERPARSVTVTRFDLDWPAPAGAGTDGPGPGAGPVFAAEIDCSSGTYIRVLAADLGRLLGGGAHVRRLRRTAVGPWTEQVAVPLESLGPQHVMAPAAAVPWLESLAVGPALA
ncbi:MAG: tRNA pseudouridine(55) synthase TruB, partial [Acidimicrobiales bacterium]